MITRGATAPITQVLNDTFVAGVTYTLSVDIFGPGGYSDSTMWSLGIFARNQANADTMLNLDHWFLGPGTGYQPHTIGAGNGGNIPNDHIIARGVKHTVSVTFTATAAIAGQRIGISLAGTTQSKYTLATTPAPPALNAWYGHYDNVSLTSTAGNPGGGPTSGTQRVIRGGGWISLARDCRSAYRTVFWPGSRSEHIGFRLATPVP
jgi:hypothetical protein